MSCRKIRGFNSSIAVKFSRNSGELKSNGTAETFEVIQTQILIGLLIALREFATFVEKKTTNRLRSINILYDFELYLTAKMNKRK